MQTFFPYKDLTRTVKVLDYRRLGKQRVEALQIADIIINKKKAWSNHPAVNMWRPYVGYLMTNYIPAVMSEWEARGYKNEKCSENWKKLLKKTQDGPKPSWLNESFCKAHRSNLLRKDKQFYGPKFEKGLVDDLPYIWG